MEDSTPSISADGRTLYFTYNRSGGVGDYDIYMTTRATRDAAWGPAVNLGPHINSSTTDGEPWISPDGLELYFESYRAGGYGDADIYFAKRLKTSDPWGAPANLGPVVNSPYREQFLSLSPDGLLLLFSDHPNFGSPRPGGQGESDMWMARRRSLSDPWQAPVNLGPVVNGPSDDWQPRFSPDGATLYFFSHRDALWCNRQAAVIPTVDFNGDGEVDSADMDLLADNWGRDEPLYDIAPFAWGDGIVDEKDLMAVMTLLMNPAQQATDVSCDTVLSWASPAFAQTHDVYFGTSFEDVDTAHRGDSRGVLVSQGQTATMYDPEGLLEFSRSYYWRIDSVDAVNGSLERTIYRGPVLKFTTEAFAYPIKSIIATASSSQGIMGPEKTVDDSGLDTNDGHSTDGSAMWQSKNVPPHWIQFEFDKVYALHELWVWNSNQLVEPILGFGARTVKIEYSVDGTPWTTLEGVPEFARAPGEPGYKPNTTVGFGGVSAKYVKLSIEANWGPVAQTGLAEVRFFYIPDRSWATTP
jgi:hypothetical protein